MSILHITKQNYEEEVVRSGKPVLLDFWAPWCMPCRMVAPVLEQIDSETDRIQVCKINVDEEPELAAQFKIMSIPTLVIVQDGAVVHQAVGVRNKAQILDMIP